MAGRPGERTARARQLIEAGASVADACAATGASTSSIYRTDWYKVLRDGGTLANRDRTVSAETMSARRHIVAGLSVPEACRRARINSSTIYRSKWYQAYIANKGE